MWHEACGGSESWVPFDADYVGFFVALPAQLAAGSPRLGEAGGGGLVRGGGRLVLLWRCRGCVSGLIF